LHTDDETVRTQSAILDNGNPTPLLFLSITVFSARMHFTSVQKTRLARRARNGRSAIMAEVTQYFELHRPILYETPAQVLSCAATAFESPYIIG